MGGTTTVGHGGLIELASREHMDTRMYKLTDASLLYTPLDSL